MQYVLETNSLTKAYNDFKAIDSLNMHVPKGSIYGLVGKNGAGKTTLIRTVCALQNPTSGNYSLYGVRNDEKKICRSRRRMGAVVETPSIYLDLSAEENIKEQYKVLGRPDNFGIKPLLKLVGLEDTGKKKAKNFSLGMKQRLGIAMALAGDPDFLLLDEPTNGLDPQGIVEIRELILKLNKERGITVLISSHILDELFKLATWYGFMNNGRILKEISSDELETMFRKCTVVKVSNLNALVKTLDSLNLEYKIISENEAELFSDISVSELVHNLDKENCVLIHAKEKDETLESYFINLVGGNSNE